MQERTELRYAAFFPRLAALTLDKLFLAAVMLVPRLAAYGAVLGGMTSLTSHALFRYSWLEIIFYLLSRAYFVLLTYFGGCTLGKRAMGLRVVNAEGGRCSFLDILYRETVGRYLSAFLCIGYLLAIGDREHRALHDRICDTRVVWTEESGKSYRPITPAPLRTVEIHDAEREWYKPYRV